jgi:hypothetical protein
METVTIDDLPIGCAPWPCLQVVHDPATFAEAGKPVAQYRRSGRTKKGQHYALGSEWRLVAGHVGAKQRDGSPREVAMGNGVRRNLGRGLAPNTCAAPSRGPRRYSRPASRLAVIASGLLGWSSSRRTGIEPA